MASLASPAKCRLLTLVLVKEANRVLLGLKKRGFGKGKWNGFGGKVEPDETIEQAALRELKEESNLTARWLKKVGIINFEFVEDPTILQVHIFTTSCYTGELKESEEMKPQWYVLDSVPYDRMWVDDKYWFPLFLKGSKFQGYFKYADHETILQYQLQEVDKFNT